jgi:hypothetical protein
MRVTEKDQEALDDFKQGLTGWSFADAEERKVIAQSAMRRIPDLPASVREEALDYCYIVAGPQKADLVDGVSVEIGDKGSVVMVEPKLRKGLTRRVFRRMFDGSLEWAAYDDWIMHNERARFFGFGSRDLPASMTDCIIR